MPARMSKQTQNAKFRQSVKEWVAFILFLAATALLVALPESGLLRWLSFTAFVPFYVWAIVAMTEAEDIKL
jgi:cytochrome b561